MNIGEIDILLATYNGEKYIREQLNSILNQTYTDFNLIISDDNSSDNTLKIINEYAKKDNRIKIYSQKKNVGYRKNFEFLCKHSSSKYVMFSDQDDVWNKDKVKIMKEVIDSNNYKLVYCDLEIVDEKLNIIHPSMIQYMKKRNQVNYNDYRCVNLDNVVTGCATIVKREIIDKSLPFPEKFFPHDWWVALIATQYGKIKYIDKSMVKYRQHGNNTIGINSQKLLQKKEFVQYRKQIIDFHKEQFDICSNHIELFSKNYQTIINTAVCYFNGLDNKKYSIINNAIMFMKIYKGVPCLRKIKHFTMYHFPKIAAVLFNLRSDKNEATKD